MVPIRCPQCRQTMKIDPRHLHRRGRCQGCGHVFRAEPLLQETHAGGFDPFAADSAAGNEAEPPARDNPFATPDLSAAAAARPAMAEPAAVAQRPDQAAEQVPASEEFPTAEEPQAVEDSAGHGDAESWLGEESSGEEPSSTGLSFLGGAYSRRAASPAPSIRPAEPTNPDEPDDHRPSTASGEVHDSVGVFGGAAAPTGNEPSPQTVPDSSGEPSADDTPTAASPQDPFAAAVAPAPATGRPQPSDLPDFGGASPEGAPEPESEPPADDPFATEPFGGGETRWDAAVHEQEPAVPDRGAEEPAAPVPDAAPAEPKRRAVRSADFRKVRLESLEAFVVELPVGGDVRASAVRLKAGSAVRRVLVRAVSSDGLEGWGEVVPGAAGTSPAAASALVNDTLAAAIAGQPLRNPAMLTHRLHAAAPMLRRLPAVVAALDQALRDVTARSLGISLHVLLGGARQKALPVMATLPTGGDVAAAMERSRGEGHAAFRVQAPSRPEAVRSLAEAVAAAVRPQETVLLDCGAAFDAAEGMRFARDLRNVALLANVLERPTPILRRRLAGLCDAALLTGDSVDSAATLLAALADGRATAALVRADLMPLADAAAMVAVADAAGLPTLVSTAGASLLGCAHAANLHATRVGALPLDLVAVDAIDSPYTKSRPIDAGVWRLSARPGCGVDIDVDDVRRLAPA